MGDHQAAAEPFVDGEAPAGRITREYTIWCGRCSQWVQNAWAKNEKAMARWARREGWSKTVEVGWVCPPCKDVRKRD